MVRDNLKEYLYFEGIYKEILLHCLHTVLTSNYGSDAWLEAMVWVLDVSEDENDIYSFESCCEQLHIHNPDVIRIQVESNRQLRQASESPKPTRESLDEAKDVLAEISKLTPEENDVESISEEMEEIVYMS